MNPMQHDEKVTEVRPDSELAGLDVADAIRSGLGTDAEARHALFTEAAIAAAIDAETLGVGPHPVGFLASLVRAGGVAATLQLPDPLIGAEPAALAHGWLEAALAAGTGIAQDQMFARWLQMVATLLAARRRAAAPRLAD